MNYQLNSCKGGYKKIVTKEVSRFVLEVEIPKRNNSIEKQMYKNEASSNNDNYYNKNGETIIGSGNLAGILLQRDFESRSHYDASKVKTEDASIWRNIAKLVKFCYNEAKSFDFPVFWLAKCPSPIPHEFT